MRVSIVIPVRAGSNYVGEAVASLTAQTRPPDELILVDAVDGPGSADLVADLPGAIALRRPRPGPAVARNTGVAAATGDLIGFLDADDVAARDRLAWQVSLLDGDAEATATVGHVEHFLSPDCEHLAGRVRVPHGAQPGWLVGALLARRETLAAVGPFDESVPDGDTLDWLERLRRNAGPVRVLDEVVLHRRIHETNESRRNAAGVHAGYLAAARAAIERNRAGGAP